MTLVHSADQEIGSIPTEQAGLSVADVLDRAADLVEGPGAWTQGFYARRADGIMADPLASDAVCFCAAGAIERVSADDQRLVHAALEAFCASVDDGFSSFNDTPGRTQAEVVAALRAAAEKARTADAASQVGIGEADKPKTSAVSS